MSIGGLSKQTTGDDLRALFSKHGTVLDALILPNKTIGFIRIDSEENQKSAIEALNGHILHGNAIRVRASSDNYKG